MTTYHALTVDGLQIFYREAGSRKNPALVLLHGFPAYQRDLPNSELHLLDTGHFALEEEQHTIAELIHRFLPGKMGREQKAA